MNNSLPKPNSKILACSRSKNKTYKDLSINKLCFLAAKRGCTERHFLDLNYLSFADYFKPNPIIILMKDKIAHSITNVQNACIREPANPKSFPSKVYIMSADLILDSKQTKYRAYLSV